MGREYSSKRIFSRDMCFAAQTRLDSLVKICLGPDRPADSCPSPGPTGQLKFESRQIFCPGPADCLSRSKFCVSFPVTMLGQAQWDRCPDANPVTLFWVQVFIGRRRPILGGSIQVFYLKRLHFVWLIRLRLLYFLIFDNGAYPVTGWVECVWVDLPNFAILVRLGVGRPYVEIRISFLTMT